MRRKASDDADAMAQDASWHIDANDGNSRGDALEGDGSSTAAGRLRCWASTAHAHGALQARATPPPGLRCHSKLLLLTPQRTTTTAGEHYGPTALCERLCRTCYGCRISVALLHMSDATPEKPLASCLAPRVKIKCRCLGCVWEVALSIGCRLPAKSTTGPKFDQPEIRFKRGARGSSLDNISLFLLYLWPQTTSRRDPADRVKLSKIISAAKIGARETN